MPTKFFGSDHGGMSFEAVFGFNVNNHGNCLQPLFLHCIVAFGVTKGASSLEASPDSIDHWNWYTKLGPFFASSFERNFRPNNNQTFIVYVKSTLVLYRKGLCGFRPVWDSPWKKSYMEQSFASCIDQRE